MTQKDTRFELIQKEGYRKEPLFEADELEEIGAFVAEKAGRGAVWELIDDGN